MTAWTEDFERHRSLVFSIEYRMLGSAAEAEDVVQEAYPRRHRASERDVCPQPSFLSCSPALAY
jgi:RNA polymerase sigma-70 factor, ECF subfamily